MKKIEQVYNYVLEQALEKKRTKMTQSEIAKALHISLSTVHAALGHLRKMHAIDVVQRSFTVVDARKILYYWASIRNIEKDIIYATRIEAPVGDIEKTMPPGVTYGAYTAYKFKYKDVPADYTEVYVYGDAAEMKRRLPPSQKRPNVFVLKPAGGSMTLANIFVDLWNLKEWYARAFLAALEERINGILA